MTRDPASLFFNEPASEKINESLAAGSIENKDNL
jgi:hypothetical protein